MPVEPNLVRDVFLSAAELPRADRERYLADRCGSDAELRAAVERLLAAHEEPARILEQGAAREVERPLATTHRPIGGTVGEDDDHTGEQSTDLTAGTTLAAHASERASSFVQGQVIAGRYTLQEVLGEGGMGTVYRALQTEPVKRQVALKIIKVGMDSRTVLARFNAERQALALMDHPNIARVYDGGTTSTSPKSEARNSKDQGATPVASVFGFGASDFCSGQPFFVMELVQGVPITGYCDAKRLSLAARLELFVSVCQAVQHAHQKGIIHRDLKPSNVMVTEVDGRPAPKVIDFGVAKAVEFDLTDQSLGDTGAIVGTPAYMSPEQADPTSMDIDTRTDIYALGVILYELLAGSPPLDPAQFRRGAILEMLRMVREVDPPRPSTKVSTSDALPNLAASRGIEPAQLKRALSGDLDWVVMKALEKDRTRRYETANGFAADISRHLSSEPVLAAPPSRAYRARKFVRKHRGAVIAAGLILAVLLAGIAGTSWEWFAARRLASAERVARLDAQKQQTRAEERETQAIDAVKRFGDAVAGEPALKNSPDLEALRKRLLKEPLAFFKDLRDRLQADKYTRPESLYRTATASSELGILTAEIGDKQDALIAHGEALEIFLNLADSNPAITELQRDLAITHNQIGMLLRETGNLAEAMMAYERALAIWRKLAVAKPAVTEFQRNLGDLHNNVGNVLVAAGKRAEAMKAHEAARSIRQKLADSNPANTDFQSRLANSHNNIGSLLAENGHPAEAIDAHRLALQIQQKLADANPAVFELQLAQATSRNVIGLQLERTDPADAKTNYEAALTIFRKLSTDNPSVTRLQHNCSATLTNIGNLLSAIGQRAEAMKAHEESLAILRKLASEHAEAPEYASALGASLNNLAHMDLAARRFGEAHDRLREAVKWQRKALAAYPAHPDYRQFLGNHLRNLRQAAIGLGDSEGAAEAERELAQLRDSDPAIVVLDARLAAVIKGTEQSRNQDERLALAQRAYDKALHATSARLWAEALTANPALAADRTAQHPYNAACAAALAGSGQAKDDPAPDEAAKVKLRKQALEWLKAEHAVWSKLLESDAVKARPLVAKALADWQKDTDLAGIRDKKELAKLPEAERSAFQQLWSDVDSLLTKASSGKP